ncbi:MAG: dihydrodipicolinate synthase family protein [Candidatus Latescibacteria bacterium]|nr:dihydrodipicolinate synthase family protein [Candidatus Latescibacterota bacterium]
MNRIRGMIVPVVTPLTASFEVDVPALKRICDNQIEAGMDGLFVLGTTGEFYGLTPVQRRVVVDVALEAAADRIPILTGISGESTAASLQMLRDSGRSEVAGYVVSSPYFFDYSQDELLDHFRALCEAAGRPLILYNYPHRYRHLLEIATVEKLLEEQNTFAIKDTSGDFGYMLRLLELRKSFPDFRVFEGALPNLARSGREGVDGAVQAIGNLLPHECVALWNRVEAGDWDHLEKDVAHAWAFHREIETVAPFIAALKACMALRGWCRATPTRPTRPVSQEGVLRLSALMDQSYPGGASLG